VMIADPYKQLRQELPLEGATTSDRILKTNARRTNVLATAKFPPIRHNRLEKKSRSD